ncbi:hypothetical protein GJ496_004909 [Pomphorhynchus laevis]|nr:hypothetical protein GJ496_004909 [Pomphorhynchus laevis]
MLPLRKRNRLIKILNRNAQRRSMMKGIGHAGPSAVAHESDNSLKSFAIRVVEQRRNSGSDTYTMQSAMNERYEFKSSSSRSVHYRQCDKLSRQQFTCHAPNNTTRFIMDDHLLMDSRNKAVMPSVKGCYYKDNCSSTDVPTDRVFIAASVDQFKRRFGESIDEEIENARYRVLFNEYLSMNKLDLAQKCADLQQRLLKCEESKEDHENSSSVAASCSHPMSWAAIKTSNCSKVADNVTSFDLVFDKEAFPSDACPAGDKNSGHISNNSANDMSQRHRSSTVFTASSNQVPTRGGGATSHMMVREAIGGQTGGDRCCIDDRH